MDIASLTLPAYGGHKPLKRRFYLRGPIDWGWLNAAMHLPGSALKVGLVLWHYRALRKSTTIRTGTGDIARFLGVSLDTARRGIDALEGAGLIEVECAPGRKCMITLFERFDVNPTPDDSPTRGEDAISPPENPTEAGSPQAFQASADLGLSLRSTPLSIAQKGAA